MWSGSSGTNVRYAGLIFIGEPSESYHSFTQNKGKITSPGSNPIDTTGHIFFVTLGV